MSWTSRTAHLGQDAAAPDSTSSTSDALRPELWTVHLVRRLAGTWAAARQWVGERVAQTRPRRLQVQETVQLGEKRFVAILRVDQKQFLIAGSATGVSLLCAMEGQSPANFGAVLAAQPEQLAPRPEQKEPS